MTWTEADQHFYQDVHRSSSAHLIDERQEAESTTNALNSEASWLQLQDNVSVMILIFIYSSFSLRLISF